MPVGGFIRAVGDLPVARTVQRAIVVQEMDVVVAAAGGVAGPLVAQEGHEPARLVVGGYLLTDRLPDARGDLEVVALMPYEVERGGVTGIGEVVVERADADGFLGLAVRIAPVDPPARRLGMAAQRVWLGLQCLLGVAGADGMNARLVYDQALEPMQATVGRIELVVECVPAGSVSRTVPR